MPASERVLVYGATGHTGGFVVDELLRRGLRPIVAGRSAARLAAAVSRHPDLEHRVASVEEPDAVRRAVADVAVVVNCAGPFLDTAVPLARAAVAAGAHYLDVTAEQPAVSELYGELDGPARAAGVAVIPAMAFYGGLADLLLTDLLLTGALQGDARAEAVEIAIGLDRWWPTHGTRATGVRNRAVRQVIRNGALAPLADPAPTGTWSYPEPLGDQPVVQLPFSEVMTIHRHLDVGELVSYLNTAPLEDLRDPATPPPSAADETGRSAQRFVVEMVVRGPTDIRRIGCSGRDIYAVTAPIVGEGVARLLDGRHRGLGAVAPGEAFDATDLLTALERETDGLTVRRDGPRLRPATVGR